MAWTDDRIDRLKAMWDEGLTASQIAEQLGEVSRNAVIGKAHRLGLTPRPSPVRTAASIDKPVVAPAEVAEVAPPAPPPPPPPPPPPVATPVSTPVTAPMAPAASTAAPLEDEAQPKIEPAKVEMRSVGPGGFLRQNPGETQLPIPPAPPRRMVPARPSADVADKTSLLDLNERICRWPMGHPGEPDFHFCGEAVNPGFPYCVSHCGNAYQAQMPRRDRKPPPPLPFGGPRVR